MLRKSALVLFLCLAACGKLSDNKAQDPTPAPVPSGFDGPATRFVGRVDQSNPAQVLMAWGGTAVETRFEGTTLEATVQASLPLTGETVAQTFVELSVDGGAPTRFFVDLTPTKLGVKVPAGIHTVRLIKTTEVLFGTMTFFGFTTDGKLLNTPTPTGRSIEFIGDSITTAAGVLKTSDNCAVVDPNTQSVSAGYALATANLLGADFSMVAFSGKGVYKNRTNDVDGVTIPALYPLLDPTNANNTFNFAAAKAPDVVVINLGTNDFAYFDLQSPAGKPDEAGFVAAMQGLVTTVRSNYPAARIILEIGPIVSNFTPGNTNQLDTWRGFVQQVVTARTAAGDANISFFELAPLADANSYGCEFHPNAAAAQDRGAALAGEIKTLMNW